MTRPASSVRFSNEVIQAMPDKVLSETFRDLSERIRMKRVSNMEARDLEVEFCYLYREMEARKLLKARNFEDRPRRQNNSNRPGKPYHR